MSFLQEGNSGVIEVINNLEWRKREREIGRKQLVRKSIGNRGC